jgi:hypothetical protein
MRTRYLRHPKGRKQGLINQARPGSLPPDAWDDIPIRNKEAYRYAKQLYLKTQKWGEFLQKFTKKFPKYRPNEIKYLFYFYRDCFFDALKDGRRYSYSDNELADFRLIQS